MYVLEPGTILNGRYRVEGALGQGGAAQVFRVEDTKFGRFVALKLLDARGPLADKERLREEAQALARVRHPHVLQVLSCGIYEEKPYLVLELAEGGSLLTRIKKEIFSYEVATRYAQQILEALQATHAQGILHRDLKPENILLSKDGSVLLSDFGLAKSQTSGVRTASGLILGTPEYMAPEVMMGDLATQASDVYSWGCLYYTLLTRKIPHKNDLQQMLADRRNENLSLSKLPALARAAIQGALRADPRRRESIESLQKILGGTLPEWALRESRATASISRPRDLPKQSHLKSPSVSAVTSVVSPFLGSSQDGPPPRLPQSRGRVFSLALGSCTLLLGGLVYLLSPSFSNPSHEHSSKVPPVSDSLSLKNPDWERQREVALQWTERLKQEFQSEKHLSKAHLSAFSGSSGFFGKTYTAEMQSRRDEKALHYGKTGELYPIRDALPFRKALRKDLEAFEGFLKDPRSSREEKLALGLALTGMAECDYYFAAWGMAPPYRIDGLQRMALGIQLHSPELFLEPVQKPTENSKVQDAPYLLFRRITENEKRYPWLLATRGDAPELDMAAGAFLTLLTKEERERRGGLGSLTGLKPSRGLFTSVWARFAVPKFEPPRFQVGVIQLALSNLIAPMCLSIEFNGRTYPVIPEVKWASSNSWDNPQPPTFIVSLRIPEKEFKGEDNDLVIRADFPKGLTSYGAIGLHWVGLKLSDSQTD